jgi:hypothetical protein
VLVVEDDPQIRAALTRSLSIRGYEVRESANGLQGLSILVDAHPDAMLLDLGLPDIVGGPLPGVVLSQPLLRVIHRPGPLSSWSGGGGRPDLFWVSGVCGRIRAGRRS